MNNAKIKKFFLILMYFIANIFASYILLNLLVAISNPEPNKANFYCIIIIFQIAFLTAVVLAKEHREK
jgi:hypothetical protein